MPDGVTARTRLRAVPPKAAEPSKPKVLIFGKPGVGKTWFALTFPNVYYIDTEGGANLAHYTDKLEKAGGVYLGQEQGSNDFSVVLDQIKALATEEHPYKTLVIDSISHLFGSEIANEQERLADARKKDEYGASRKPAISYMRRIVNWLDRLDMNVIIVAQQRDEYGVTDKGERGVIGETFDCWDKLEYILHLAFQAFNVGNAYKARVRKSRLVGFPKAEVFELSYDAFADRYGRDVIESAVHTVDLADAEQIAELNDLMERVNMPPDWLEKCLKKDKAEYVRELSRTAVAAMCKMLKERIAL